LQELGRCWPPGDAIQERLFRTKMQRWVKDLGEAQKLPLDVVTSFPMAFQTAGGRHTVDLLLHLKRHPAQSVNELCAPLKMSYMGIKQHLIELEKKHLVETARRPKPAGRPEKIYSLSPKLAPLFPDLSTQWTLGLLDTASEVFGEQAAEKLIYLQFQQRSEHWNRLTHSHPLNKRLKLLVKTRLDEGYLSHLQITPDITHLTDFHSPYWQLAERYPLVLDLEMDNLSTALQTPVTQSLQESPHLQRVIYSVAASDDAALSTQPSPSPI
jgi:predicted ArsR family transcriptional regulator